MLSLRKVNLNDARLIFNWANDPDVRNNSFNTNEIVWDEHVKWFHKKIQTDSIWLILEKENKPVGVIRFDKGENSFLLNYSIAKEFRGFGYGKKIVELGIENLVNQKNEITTIEAHVKVNNKASQKIFNSLGFDNVFLEDEYIFKKVFL